MRHWQVIIMGNYIENSHSTPFHQIDAHKSQSKSQHQFFAGEDRDGRARSVLDSARGVSLLQEQANELRRQRPVYSMTTINRERVFGSIGRQRVPNGEETSDLHRSRKESTGEETSRLHRSREESLGERSTGNFTRRNLSDVSSSSHNDLAHATIEGTSSLAAGIGGAACYALLGGLGARRLLLAPLVGGLSKLVVKSTSEACTMKPEERTTSVADFGWGAIDGLSGILGARAESWAARTFARKAGATLLGRATGEQVAEQAGRRCIESSIGLNIASSASRGMAGGLAGTFTYALPHNISDRQKEFQSGDFGSALAAVARDTALHSAIGMASGGVLGASFSAIANRRHIAGHVASAFDGSSKAPALKIFHTNDMHSNIEGPENIAKLAYKKNALAAEANPLATHFYDLGDEHSGNVIAGFTNAGETENAAMRAMNYTARLPGNHATDNTKSIGDYLKIAGKFGRERTLASNVTVDESLGFGKRPFADYMIKEFEGPNGPERVGLIGLVTNELDGKGATVLEHTEQARRAIDELTKQGVNKIVVLSHLGLEADIQLAKDVPQISAIVGGHSHDPLAMPVWVTTSLRDIPVAQAGSNGKWLGELNLSFKNDGSVNRYRTTGRLHAITADLPEDPAVRSIINQRTVQRQQIMDALTISEPELVKQIKEMTGRRPSSRMKFTTAEVIRLYRRQKGFGNAKPSGEYTADQIRCRETALGNFISDGLLAGINRHLAQAAEQSGARPKALNGFLKHSGDIRNGIAKDEPLNLYSLANVFCNGQNTRELAIANLTGKQLRNVLEFSIEDMGAKGGNLERSSELIGHAMKKRLSIKEAAEDIARLAPQKTVQNAAAQNTAAQSSLKGSLKQIFQEQVPEPVDHSGNFLQGSGIKYSYDLTEPPGRRITSVKVFDPESGKHLPLADDQLYSFGTLKHPVEKWAAKGVFFDDANFWKEYDRALEEMLGFPSHKDVITINNEMRKEALKIAGMRLLGVSDGPTHLGLSQPQLIADYVSGKTSLPKGLSRFAGRRDSDGKLLLAPSLTGRVEGRISDATRARTNAGVYSVLADGQAAGSDDTSETGHYRGAQTQVALRR